MADTGVEFAQEVEIKYLNEAIKELGRKIQEISSKQAFAENIVRGLKTPDILMNDFPVTEDRIQIMETGEIRLKTPVEVPPDTCVEEISKEFGKNGKKETAVAELAEVVNAS